ncbi:MAG: hypothetical protein Q8R20_03655 [Nanoarchaeota archaeon]|nr:hypothetical protein [Nanoarchaeota archaeon]
MKKKRKEFTPAKRKKIRRRILFSAGILLGVTLIGASIYIGVFSDVPKVREVRVHGNRLVGEKEIIVEAVRVLEKEDWWKNVLGRDHILFWRPGNIQGIEKTLRKLKTARVERSMEKRAVIIEVEEEEANGVWCVPGGVCFAFNEKGVLFAESPDVRGYLIIKIMGEEGAPTAVGDEVLGNAEWFQNIRKTIEGVEGAGIKIRSAEMRDRGRKEWSIETAEGAEMLFSLDRSPENIGLILQELKKEGEKGRIMDFRVPEKIYIK